QLYCLAISAKRYALYTHDDDGRPLLRTASEEDDFVGERWSEHGLGHLLDPYDPESNDRDWIRQLWQHEIHRALGLDLPTLDWLDRAAIGRVTTAKPRALDAFRHLNENRP